MEIKDWAFRSRRRSKSIDRTQLNRKATVIFRKWTDCISVLRQVRSGLLFSSGPAPLLLNLVQVLTICKWNDLLFEAERIDEWLLFFLDWVFIGPIYDGFLKRELILLILTFVGGQSFSLHHRSGHISVKTHCVSAVLSIRNCAVLAQTRLSSPALHILVLRRLLVEVVCDEKHLLVDVERCIPSSYWPGSEVLDLSALVAISHSFSNPSHCVRVGIAAILVAQRRGLLSCLEQSWHFPRLNMAGGHCLVVEWLWVEVYCRMLIYRLVSRLAHTKGGNIVGFESTLARNGVMMGSVLSIRWKVCDLEGIDRCGLVAGLDKTLEVRLPVVV